MKYYNLPRTIKQPLVQGLSNGFLTLLKFSFRCNKLGGQDSKRDTRTRQFKSFISEERIWWLIHQDIFQNWISSNHQACWYRWDMIWFSVWDALMEHSVSRMSAFSSLPQYQVGGAKVYKAESPCHRSTFPWTSMQPGAIWRASSLMKNSAWRELLSLEESPHWNNSRICPRVCRLWVSARVSWMCWGWFFYFPISQSTTWGS